MGLKGKNAERQRGGGVVSKKKNEKNLSSFSQILHLT